jgi:hypothetical protein
MAAPQLRVSSLTRLSRRDNAIITSWFQITCEQTEERLYQISETLPVTRRLWRATQTLPLRAQKNENMAAILTNARQMDFMARDMIAGAGAFLCHAAELIHLRYVGPAKLYFEGLPDPMDLAAAQPHLADHFAPRDRPIIPFDLASLAIEKRSPAPVDSQTLSIIGDIGKLSVESHRAYFKHGEADAGKSVGAGIYLDIITDRMMEFDSFYKKLEPLIREAIAYREEQLGGEHWHLNSFYAEKRNAIRAGLSAALNEFKTDPRPLYFMPYAHTWNGKH